MKTWQKLAATAAVIVVIAFIALFVRNNWGSIVDSGIKTIFKGVTGQETNFSEFEDANGAGGDNDDTVDMTWE